MAFYRNRISGLIDGFISALDLFFVLGGYYDLKCEIMGDYKAIAIYWQAVGDGLRKAMGLHSEKNKGAE